jgi:membrane-associated PAP2 superfamily phosphatase
MTRLADMAGQEVVQERPERSLASWPWIIPFLLLAAATVSARIFDLDRSISRLLYDPKAAQPWPLGNTELARILEEFVWIPAVALAIAALVLAAIGLFRRRRSAVRAGVILLLSLV